jgi:hypothetical protein
MSNLIGYEPNQIPVNGFLGDLAYQNSTGAVIEKVQSPIGIATNLELNPGGGGVVVGIASTSLGTTATTGFLYVPTCRGVPVGVAQSLAGAGVVPIVVDITNNRIYVGIGTTWISASLT